MALQSKAAMRARVASKPAAKPVLPSRKVTVCKAQQGGVQQKLASVGAAAMLSLGSLAMGNPAAIASEFDIMAERTPTEYFIDDASVLSKATRGDVTGKLKSLEEATGYRVEVVTVRKLEFETDPFAFAEKALKNWYPDSASDKKGVLLLVTTSKEGALIGGDKFNKAVGEDLIDSIAGDNIPIYAEEEKYNASVLTSLDRIEAQLQGKPVPDAPARADNTRRRTYKTKDEFNKSKDIYTTVVASLLFIAVVVPMLQYYGYTAKD